MKSNYDKQADALYIKFNKGQYQESVEMDEGIIFDYDQDGKLLAIEVLDASTRFQDGFTKQITEDSPVAITVETR